MARALLDMKDGGKVLLLITNSDHEYTDKMMSFAYDRYLPEGMVWRDLFDMVSCRCSFLWIVEGVKSITPMCLSFPTSSAS